MPPKQAKRKSKEASQDATNQDDFLGATEEVPRKKPRTSTASTSRVNEYDEDEGRQKSKTFMDWAQWQSDFSEKEKKIVREYMAAFKQKVQKNQENVQKCLDQSKGDLNSAGNSHAAIIKEAYNGTKAAASIRPKQTDRTQTLAIKSRQNHPLFAAGKNIIASCRNIVAVHNEANTKSQGSKICLPRNKWKDDEANIQELLLFGRQYGEKIAECIILPDTDKSILTPDQETLGETGKMAIDMYKKSSEGLNKTTWGETARGQAVAFTNALNELSIS